MTKRKAKAKPTPHQNSQRAVALYQNGPDAAQALADEVRVADRLLRLLRLLENTTGRKWPGLDLRQLALAEWMATPTWDRPQAERSLVGWCLANRVPDRTARRWRQHPRVVDLVATIVDVSLGSGSYDTQVWQNLVRRTAISDDAIRTYFELRGKLAGRGQGVNVFTGPVDARQQGLTIPVDDAESYKRALEMFGEGDK